MATAAGYVRDLWISAETKQPTKRYGKVRRWQANWYVDGEKRSATFDRKIDAQNHLTKTVAAILSGDYVDPKTGKVTVRSFAERWLADQLQLRSATRARYRSHLTKHVFPVIGDRPIREVKKSTVQGLVSGLVEKGLAPGTVRGIHRTLSIVFSAAVGDQVIPRQPCVGVKLPAPAESRSAALTPQQLYGLTAHLPPHFAALVLVGASTGLRPAELFGLELDPAHSLDMLGRKIRVRQQLTSDTGGGQPYLAPPKTAAGVRDVPLADATLEVLAQHMAQFPPIEVELEDRTGPRPQRRTARLVFQSVEETLTGVASGTGRKGCSIDGCGRKHYARGWCQLHYERAIRAQAADTRTWTDRRTPIRRSTFNTTWNRAVARARAAGVDLPPRVTPHSLRHTYVSLLIAAGVNAKAIQVQVGHANIRETFDTYGHLFDDQHEVSRDAIGAALRRDEAPGLRSVQI